jgi:hypothetical protein
MTPERIFEIAKRTIMEQLPGLPEDAIQPRTSPSGAYVETRRLTLHLCYTGLPLDQWTCCINGGDVETQFSVDFVLQLALDGWRILLNRQLDALDLYTSPPDLD